MPEFEMPKSFDQTEKPKIAPDGVYDFIVSRCELQPNRNENGMNLEIDLTLVNDPDYEGIRQTIYAAMPNPTDEGRTTKQGQPMADFKMDRMKELITSLGGAIKGKKFEIPENAMVQAKVEKKMGDNGPYNRIEGPLIAKEAKRKKLS